jgi:hypothetical protein
LTDHGGSTITNPKLAIVYLGQWWGDVAKLELFAKELMEFGYLAPLNVYGSGNGTYIGAFHGPALTPGTVNDAQLQNYLTAMIAAGTVPAPDGHTLYALCLPSGVTSSDGSSSSCSQFCGYHSALPDGKTFYSVQPATDCAGCNEGDAFDGFTAVLAHEVAEACTDAIPGQGWYNDATGMENADEWAWPRPFHRYGPWAVQGYQVNGVGDDFGTYTPVTPVPQPKPQPPPANCRAIIDTACSGVQAQLAALAASDRGGGTFSRAAMYAYAESWRAYEQAVLDAAAGGTTAAVQAPRLHGWRLSE